MSIFIGIDLGTSGVRACAIDDQEQILGQSSHSLDAPITDGPAITQDANLWWQALQQALQALLKQIDQKSVKAIAIDGTSGTVLVTDDRGTPLGPALMYNDGQCVEEAQQIKQVAPNNCAAHGVSSGLAKLLHLQAKYPQATHMLHQADWIAAKFTGNYQNSDENNALKTGYDPIKQQWPDWLDQLNVNRQLLPNVMAPGTSIGKITESIAQLFNLNANVQIVAGTTDSIAAFIATGVKQPGEAVTSLGSTLVLKIISEKPVYSAEYGIYSHKLGDYWLAGGASNSGGAVLKQFFTDEQLEEMSAKLKPENPTGLDYYPLTKTGERFPVNDATLKPKLDPRPDEDVEFFQGIIESISRIELDGYKKLHELGAPYPVSVQTAGGGSKNKAWTTIRLHHLNVPVYRAPQTEACYGSALLAKRAFG